MWAFVYWGFFAFPTLICGLALQGILASLLPLALMHLYCRYFASSRYWLIGLEILAQAIGIVFFGPCFLTRVHQVETRPGNRPG